MNAYTIGENVYVIQIKSLLKNNFWFARKISFICDRSNGHFIMEIALGYRIHIIQLSCRKCVKKIK